MEMNNFDIIQEIYDGDDCYISVYYSFEEEKWRGRHYLNFHYDGSLMDYETHKHFHPSSEQKKIGVLGETHELKVEGGKIVLRRIE